MMTDDTQRENNEQPEQNQFPFSGGSYVVLFDSARIEEPEARRWFAAQGQPEDLKLRGGGGYGGGVIGPVVLEGGGGGSGAVGPAGEQVGYGQGGGFLGYVLRDSDHWRVFVLAGGGGGGLTITTPEQADASEQDDAPEPEAVATTGSGFALFGLGVDVIIPIWKLAMLVGLRFGWRQAFGPPESPVRSGPFLRVIAGAQFGR